MYCWNNVGNSQSCSVDGAAGGDSNPAVVVGVSSKAGLQDLGVFSWVRVVPWQYLTLERLSSKQQRVVSTHELTGYVWLTALGGVWGRLM